MIMFLESCLIGFALFIWIVSLYERKTPKGLIEWILTFIAIAIMISWYVKY